MTRRKRILWCGEYSPLSTGFATYQREILTRLYNTGKYEIAELANYGVYLNGQLDQRRLQFPWMIYGVTPKAGDENENRQFNENPTNQFGRWRFEETCLDFKPDIVCSVLDYWMATHLFSSPYRKNYKIAFMPAVDSVPIKSEWIDMIAQADAVFGYVDWCLEVLNNCGGGLIKVRKAASPSANLLAYKPVPDKVTHKIKCGLDPDWFIIGTVMRNQKRKLYPNLMRAFRKFLDKNKTENPELYSKAYLYCHTSYPDLGWDIPELLKEFGLSRKVLFTYVCRACNNVFPSFFQDARTICPQCNKPEACLPNVNTSVSQAALGEIMNLFSVYIQYHSNEGYGMPIAEAAACGVPVMATDYSAPSDIIRKLNGYTIDPITMFRAVDTGAWQSLPNDDDFINKLTNFALLGNEEHKKIAVQTRENLLHHFDYDKAANQWAEYFDEVELEDERKTWLSPPRLHTPAQQIPNNISIIDFIPWALTNILGEPEKGNTYFGLKLIRDINYGMHAENAGDVYFNEDSMAYSRINWAPCTPYTIADMLKQMCELRNYWEQRRVGQIALPGVLEFVAQAHQDMQIKQQMYGRR